MKYSLSFYLLICITSFLLVSCNGPEVIYDLSDASYGMVNQDSASVQFPDDFKGDILVVGFIYTHCPDVCSVITANMKNISKEFNHSSDVQFVEITFDPPRDTPSVLKAYMEKFKLNPQSFTMLTGDSTTIDTLLNSMDIKAERVDSAMTEMNHGNHNGYLMNHTNRIMVIDRQGRVRFEYPGSVAPEDMVIEDINRLR